MAVRKTSSAAYAGVTPNRRPSAAATAHSQSEILAGVAGNSVWICNS